MAFQIKIDESAAKELKKIDPQHAREILRFLRDRIAPSEDPRVFGKPLLGNELGGLWRFRVRDYRIITDIRNNELVVLILKVGHRKDVYE